MTDQKKAKFTSIPVLLLAITCIMTPIRVHADSNPYIGEITAMGISGFCPRGWASAEGQLLAISQNDALFSLLGTTYGGDGRTTFGLPDLRSRIPVGVGNGPGLTPHTWGQKTGNEHVNLTVNQLASHTHAVNANNLDGNKPGPGGKLLAAAPPNGTGTETIYSTEEANVQMSSEMIASTGTSTSIKIQDPSLVIRYCIATTGIYPSRS